MLRIILSYTQKQSQITAQSLAVNVCVMPQLNGIKIHAINRMARGVCNIVFILF